MADRPNFRKSPSADAKKVSFAKRVTTKLKSLFTATKSEEMQHAEEFMTRRMTWLSALRKRHRAPERKNGEQEMARRRRQIAKGMIQVSK